MKNKPIFTLLAGLLLCLNQATLNAQSASDIFNSSKTTITWLGVDFTQVKVVGETGTVSPSELISLFEKINGVIINESDKYNFKEALNKSDIPYDLGPVNKLNGEIDTETILSSSSAEKGRIDEALIATLVKKYEVKKPEGVGLVFFMETLDKPSETGTMWVTFFSLSDHKVLLAEKMSGKAAGFGFRNHWARTVYEVIKQIKKTEYKAWKAKYGKS